MIRISELCLLNFSKCIYIVPVSRIFFEFQVFSSLTDSTTINTCRDLEKGIDEICWLVCRKIYLDRPHPVFTDNSVYQLFRIFCLLAEMEADVMDSSYVVSEILSSRLFFFPTSKWKFRILIFTFKLFQVTMHSDEVAQVASQLVTSLGLCWDSADFSALSLAIGTFRCILFHFNVHLYHNDTFFILVKS